MARAIHATALALGLALSGSASAVSLTGICGFPTDDAGNWKIGWYNTHGPDPGKNAYITVGDVGGDFVNSGNNASTGIILDLNTPGIYHVYAFFDGNEMTAGRETWGVNLFFDGNNSTPGISAFGRARWATDSGPISFSANGGNTLDITGLNSVAGANQLSYTVGDKTITLTSLATTADVYSLDRVDNFALGASGRNDHIAVMELTVVPEPASLAILGLGIAGLARRRRR